MQGVPARTAARPSRASCGSSPTRRRRSPRSPRARARPSIAANSPRRWTSYAKATGGALRRNDLAEHKRRLGRSDRPHLSRHDAARDPAVGPGHRRLHGARHPRELRRRRPRSATAPEVAHLRIEAMKLAFADIWRYVADPRFMEVTPAQMLDKHYLKSRAKLIDPEEGQGLRPGHAQGRRHDLSRHRRRVGHDGVADPVELHRLRLGHRRAGHGHRAAEPRQRASSRPRAIPTRSARRSGRSTPSSPPSSPRTASRSRPSA